MKLEQFKEKKASVSNLTKSGTKCDLYFVKNQSAEYFFNLQKQKTTELVYDETEDNNLRFIGKNPYNYLDFNNDYTYRGYYSESSEYYRVYDSYEECTSSSSYNYNCEKRPAWRIIGVMNNIEDENGNTKSYLKIIRDSIGDYSWDSSKSYNGGSGINEWSEADIQKVLNENYYKKEAGGVCYRDSKESLKDCPKWENIGLAENARNVVSKVKWYTGTINFFGYNQRTTKDFYKGEKSENTKICSSGSSCNDKVERTTSWIGYVGLMYPSDYGYATAGGSIRNRETCITYPLISNHTSDYTDCYQNNWLFYELGQQWTITPFHVEDNATYVIYVDTGTSSGDPRALYINASHSAAVRPTVYLNSNIKIEEDTSEDYGSINNPFRLVSD